MPKALTYIQITADGPAAQTLCYRQEAIIETFCKREGIEIVEAFRDIGVSALTPFHERPAGLALTKVPNRDFDFIVVVNASSIAVGLKTLQTTLQMWKYADILIAGQ